MTQRRREEQQRSLPPQNDFKAVVPVDGYGCVDPQGGARTVVVGVKLDSHGKELLTWSLVKVAHPGDRLIALHVLPDHEIVDKDGKSSLLSLVKAFDSILAVYEGFCNLKQVDLKLKICRGSSIRKILVCEAESYSATELILGTASRHHTIRSSATVAKYCARKLSKKTCSVRAVRNGKIVFQREASSKPNFSDLHPQGNSDHQPMLNIFHQRRITSKKPNDGGESPSATLECDKGGHPIVEVDADCADNNFQEECTICSPHSGSSGNSQCQRTERPDNSDPFQGNSMAIVPVKKSETGASSISGLIKGLPEVKPGWPLLRRALLSRRQESDLSLVRQSSVVQWAMHLPSRYLLMSPTQLNWSVQEENEPSDIDQQCRAIVPVATGASDHPSLHRDSKSLPKELEGLHEKYSATCRLFEYQELQTATSNFAPGSLIGKGGSSLVYRGCLSDGRQLAVKILKPSEDLLKEFALEIEIINSLHHKNIISLFGFCYEGNNFVMVYDLLPRGSLEENLHGDKKDLLAFGWNERYKVAVGVAEALNYLHNNRDEPVIHRDVKSSNILLSDDFEPQLSDFGLAERASTSLLNITCTDVAGTFGYLAPEYFMYGRVTDKIDVYAFGVVLLELLSGRRPISNDHPKGQESLVVWAKPILHGGKISQLLDPSLGTQYNSEKLERMVLAATLCIRRAPRARPQMSLILKLLEGDTDAMKWARLEVNASEVPDRFDDDAFPSANIQSHLNLALLDVEDDSISLSSIEQHFSLEDYLRGRWSRSSSFD